MTLRLILTATGFHRTLPLFGLAALVGMAVPDGMVERLGPFALQPAVPVAAFVPVLVGFAFGIVNAAWPVAVVARCGRLFASRAVSLVAAILLAAIVIASIAALSEVVSAATLTRNVLWMVSVSLVVGTVAGATYAWIPGVVFYLFSIIWGHGQNSVSLYALLFTPAEHAMEIVVPTCLAVISVVIGVTNPRNLGWLPRSGRSATRSTGRPGSGGTGT